MKPTRPGKYKPKDRKIGWWRWRGGHGTRGQNTGWTPPKCPARHPFYPYQRLVDVQKWRHRQREFWSTIPLPGTQPGGDALRCGRNYCCVTIGHKNGFSYMILDNLNNLNNQSESDEFRLTFNSSSPPVCQKKENMKQHELYHYHCQLTFLSIFYSAIHQQVLWTKEGKRIINLSSLATILGQLPQYGWIFCLITQIRSNQMGWVWPIESSSNILYPYLFGL